MKKLLILITACVLAVCSLFAAGCAKENKPNNDYQKTYIQPVMSDTYISMVMVEKQSFYYPTISGKINLDFYPTKLKVQVEDKGSFDVKTEDYTDILCLNDRYVVSFSKEHIFGQLEEGDYKVSITVFDKDKPFFLDFETVFSVDDLYTGMAIFDWETGESFYAMDKESNWTRPY